MKSGKLLRRFETESGVDLELWFKITFMANFKINLDELNPFTDESLRDYQSEAKKKIYDFWKTKRSVMLQMPTGTGKTRLFVSIAKDFHNWAIQHKTAVKILILAHRHELIDQIDTHLGLKYGLAHGIIMAKSLEQKSLLFK